MNTNSKSNSLHTVLLVLITILILGVIAYILYYNTQKSNTHFFPVPVPVPAPHVIGGCKGTRYGCCPDGIRAKKDIIGSNC